MIAICVTDQVRTLKKRADFLALRHAPAKGKRGFLLVRGRASRSDDGEPIVRVGYTVTKRMGNAVRRNRIKRRLRAAIFSATPLLNEDDADYVVIARAAAFDQSFDALCSDMKEALTALRKDRHKGSAE